MPGGDGTGPVGYGPMTGRAMGYCVGYATPGFGTPGFGAWGLGGGRAGGGRGRRNRFYATGMTGWQRAAWGGPVPHVPTAPSRDEELDILRAQAEQMGGVLEDIQARIAELGKAGAEKPQAST